MDLFAGWTSDQYEYLTFRDTGSICRAIVSRSRLEIRAPLKCSTPRALRPAIFPIFVNTRPFSFFSPTTLPPNRSRVANPYRNDSQRLNSVYHLGDAWEAEVLNLRAKNAAKVAVVFFNPIRANEYSVQPHTLFKEFRAEHPAQLVCERPRLCNIFAPRRPPVFGTMLALLKRQRKIRPAFLIIQRTSFCAVRRGALRSAAAVTRCAGLTTIVTVSSWLFVFLK